MLNSSLKFSFNDITSMRELLILLKIRGSPVLNLKLVWKYVVGIVHQFEGSLFPRLSSSITPICRKGLAVKSEELADEL